MVKVTKVIINGNTGNRLAIMVYHVLEPTNDDDDKESQ